MTDWIKVDAEHMPPDMEPVLATVFDKLEKTKEVSICRWNGKTWDTLCDVQGSLKESYFQEIWDDLEKVTHWMPYPAPAQD